MIKKTILFVITLSLAILTFAGCNKNEIVLWVGNSQTGGITESDFIQNYHLQILVTEEEFQQEYDDIKSETIKDNFTNIETTIEAYTKNKAAYDYLTDYIVDKLAGEWNIDKTISEEEVAARYSKVLEAQGGETALRKKLNENKITEKFYKDRIAKTLLKEKVEKEILSQKNIDDAKLRFNAEYNFYKFNIIGINKARAVSAEDALKEKNQIMERLEAGEDFDIIREEKLSKAEGYNPDNYGLVFSANNTGSELELFVLSLDHNEFGFYETDENYFIIKRYDTRTEEQFQSIKEDIINELGEWHLKQRVETDLTKTPYYVYEDRIAAI